MKKLSVLLLSFLLVFVGAVEAQDKSKKELRKERRELKKLKKQEELASNLDSIKNMIKDRSFAVEANIIRGRYETTSLLQPHNFIKIDGNRVVVQTANPYRNGLNGLGGITVEGNLMNYEFDELHSGVNVRMTVSSVTFGTFNIYLNVNASGDANASLVGNLGLRANFIGDIASVSDPNQFEGIRSF